MNRTLSAASLIEHRRGCAVGSIWQVAAIHISFLSLAAGVHTASLNSGVSWLWLKVAAIWLACTGLQMLR